MYRGKMAALVCLFVCLLTIPVKAYNTNMEYEQPEIAPRMTYISDADCYFYIEDCVASVDAFVRGYPSTATKCEIVVELQEKSFLRWETAFGIMQLYSRPAKKSVVAGKVDMYDFW